jgi:excisionase family DNA binding protein
MDEWLTLEQIAEELQFHIETVRGWVRAKQLTAYRTGKSYRVKRSDLDQFLAKRRTTGQDTQ